VSDRSPFCATHCRVHRIPSVEYRYGGAFVSHLELRRKEISGRIAHVYIIDDRLAAHRAVDLSNCATCRVSLRYKKTDDGLADRSLSPFVFARATDNVMRHASSENCPPRDSKPVVTVIAHSRAGTDCAEREQGLGLTEDVNGVVSTYIDVVGRHIHDGAEHCAATLGRWRARSPREGPLALTANRPG
jgi:hypothetical protein